MVIHRSFAFGKIELSIKSRARISENDGSQDHETINNRVRKVRNQNIGVRLPDIRRRYPRYWRAPNRLNSDAIHPRLVNDVTSRDFRNRSENQREQRTWRTTQREYRSDYSPHFAGSGSKDSFRLHEPHGMRDAIDDPDAGGFLRISAPPNCDFRRGHGTDVSRAQRDPVLEIRPGDRDSARRANERTTEERCDANTIRCYIERRTHRRRDVLKLARAHAQDDATYVPVARRTRTEQLVARDRDMRIPLSPLFVARTASSSPPPAG